MSKFGGGTIAEACKPDCSPTELRSKKGPQAIDISPRWGESINNVLLHFHFANFAVSIFYRNEREVPRKGTRRNVVIFARRHRYQTVKVIDTLKENLYTVASVQD